MWRERGEGGEMVCKGVVWGGGEGRCVEGWYGQEGGMVWKGVVWGWCLEAWCGGKVFGVGCITGYQVIRVIRIFAKIYPFE